MSKGDIVEQITSEVLNEIKTSDKTFSNKEIREKINKKLDTFFENQEEKHDIAKEDQILNSMFTTIDSEDNSSFVNSLEESEDLEEIEAEETIEKKEKQGFFQEVKDTYKDEFNNSVNCFKNAFKSLKLAKDTSTFETILVFVFLSIPAIVAGLWTLLIVLLLLLLWQIYLLTNTTRKILDSFATSLKETNESIKKKILKSNKSGFINKLILSNALYTLIMFNGAIFMLIKGLTVPLKSISDAEKVLANLVAKINTGITATLKAPSQLALANTEVQAVKSVSSQKKQKKQEKIKNNNLKILKKKKTKEKSEKVKEVEAFNQILKPIEGLQEQLVKPQQKQEKQDDVSKVLHENNSELTKNIANNLKNETSQQKVQEINDIAIGLAEKPERQKDPISSALTPSFDLSSKSILLDKIFENVVKDIKESVEKTIEKTIDNIKETKNTFEEQQSNIKYQEATDNPLELKVQEARNELKIDNNLEIKHAEANGVPLKEAILQNEGNDARQLVEKLLPNDQELQNVIKQGIEYANENNLNSDSGTQVIASKIVEHFKEQGLSQKEIEDKFEALAPIIEGVKEEMQEFNNIKEDLQKDYFKDILTEEKTPNINSKNDRSFVERVEDKREHSSERNTSIDN